MGILAPIKRSASALASKIDSFGSSFSTDGTKLHRPPDSLWLKKLFAYVLIGISLLFTIAAANLALHVNTADGADVFGKVFTFVLFFGCLFFSVRWRLKLSGHLRSQKSVLCSTCGQENSRSGRICWNCGNELVSAEVMSSPQSVGASLQTLSSSAVRSGKKLLVPVNGVLPNACVKCGAAGVPHPYKFGWLDPAYYVLVVFGVLPYLLIRPFLRKTVKLLVPLCDSHYCRVRRTGIASAVALSASIPTGFIVGVLLGGAWGFLLAVVLLLGGLVLLWAHYPLQATHIDKEKAVFGGANDDFLRQLPENNEAFTFRKALP